MAEASVARLSPTSGSERRSVRYGFDIPLWVNFHNREQTLIREGRGTELSDYGICVIAIQELEVGEKSKLSLPFHIQASPFECPVLFATGMDYGTDVS